MIVKTVKNTCKENDKEYKGGLIASLDSFHKEARKKEEDFRKKIDESQKGTDKNKLIEQNVLKIINEDIDILRDITVKSVLKAIGLEKAFCSNISNNVNLIIIEVRERVRFDNWIKANISKIKEDEFSRIERERETYETKKKVFDYINKLRSKLS